MTTWFRRLGSRLGSLATEDPFPEYSSMDARDGLARMTALSTPQHRRLVAVPAPDDRREGPTGRSGSMR